MNAIRVIKPGILTTVQDLGRKGYQQYGMSVAGAMDSFALQAANLMVGNPREEAGLEITFPGFEAEFLCDCVIAVTGGDLGAKINERYIPRWKSIYVYKGSRIIFGKLGEGCRAYLAIAGGIEVPVIMGSKSTYLRGKIGGYKGRKLAADDILQIGKLNKAQMQMVGKRLPIVDIPKYKQPCKVRVVLGPQQDAFTKKSIQTFLTQPYKVGQESDRMGYRLEGPKLEHIEKADIISDGIPLGAVQVPGHGTPIIMLADRQTTGGYTKIATVVSVDISKLAQLRPGDEIRFEQVDVEEAHKLLKKQEDILNRLQNTTTIPKIRSYTIIVNGKSYDVSVEE
ncbi:MAG: antagonist of KipI [Clostridiales bacterium]|jgi:biotin-dependent carboxylase-like uncharacterized protein|nr:antagonist of KipI [Clostridiales bacterium]MDK2932239.1 antagonist of KipI [Clostridiales bacterium]